MSEGGEFIGQKPFWLFVVTDGGGSRSDGVKEVPRNERGRRSHVEFWRLREESLDNSEAWRIDQGIDIAGGEQGIDVQAIGIVSVVGDIDVDAAREQRRQAVDAVVDGTQVLGFSIEGHVGAHGEDVTTGDFFDVVVGFERDTFQVRIDSLLGDGEAFASHAAVVEDVPAPCGDSRLDVVRRAGTDFEP